MTEKESIRPPAVADMFYSGDPKKLREKLQQMLSTALPAEAIAPKAIIAPHAGYMYSGPIAATAYQLLYALRGTITRVLLLGPIGLAVLEESSILFRLPVTDMDIAIKAMQDIIQEADGKILSTRSFYHSKRFAFASRNDAIWVLFSKDENPTSFEGLLATEDLRNKPLRSDPRFQKLTQNISGNPMVLVYSATNSMSSKALPKKLRRNQC